MFLCLWLHFYRDLQTILQFLLRSYIFRFGHKHMQCKWGLQGGFHSAAAYFFFLSFSQKLITADIVHFNAKPTTSRQKTDLYMAKITNYYDLNKCFCFDIIQ